MKTKIITALSLLIVVFALPSCKEGEISSEFLRVAKVKSLSFKPTSDSDNRRIELLVQRSGHNYRISEWKSQWKRAQDRNYIIYCGGAAKSENNHVMFIIVWSKSQERVVFSEIGFNKSGVYPSGIASSP